MEFFFYRNICHISKKVEDLFQREIKPGEKSSAYTNRVGLSLENPAFELMLYKNKSYQLNIFKVLLKDIVPVLKVLTGDTSVYKMARAANKYRERKTVPGPLYNQAIH